MDSAARVEYLKREDAVLWTSSTAFSTRLSKRLYSRSSHDSPGAEAYDILAMKKSNIEETGSAHTARGSRHVTASPTTAMPPPRIPLPKPSAMQLTTQDERDIMQKSMDALKEIGIMELLDQDDRLCFIVDLTNKANYQPGPLRLVFANKVLKTSSFLDAVCGKLSDDSTSFDSFPEFKSWTLSFVQSFKPLDVSLPSFIFSGATWTCSSLRKQFRVFYGVPTIAAAFSNSAPSSGTPRLNHVRDAGHHAATAYQEPKDYFGDAYYSGPASPPRSPLANPALKSPSITGKSMQASIRAAKKNSSRMASSPLAAPATKIEQSNPSVPKSTHPADPQPRRHNSNIPLTDGVGFFDWTRLPLTPTLPHHIQFVKSVDWAATSLGPMESWSPDLRLVCNLLMASPHPAAIYWGPDNVAIYNEQYILMAGQKHPRLMGMKYEDAWEEIWDDIKDTFMDVKTTGQAVMRDDDHLFLNRVGFLEETYFSWSLVPLVSRDGSVCGLYNLAFEKTRKNISQRRILTLREVGEATAAAKDVQSFWNQVLRGIEYNEYDAPFVLLYSVTGDRGSDDASAQSTRSFGASECAFEGSLPELPRDHQAVPARVDLRNDTEGFAPAFREALTTEKPVLVDTESGRLDPKLIEDVGCRGFPEKPRAAVVCPIHPTDGESILGFLVMGINPRRPYDDDYSLFVQLLSRQLGTSMASVVLFEEEIKRGQKAAKIAALDRIELSEQLAARTKEAVESDVKFTRMAEVAPVGMLIADSKGQIVFTNDTFHALSKHPRQSDRNAWIDSVRVEDQEMVRKKWQELVNDKIPMSAEFRFKAQAQDSDGQTGDTWVLASAYPETDQDGLLQGIFGCITNISTQKWAEDVQIQRTAEANEMRLQQSRFVDIICHEIRNPLSAILQCADEISASLLEYKTDSTDPSIPIKLLDSNIDAAQTISLCSVHQTRIVSDVLTISKLDSALLLVTPVDVRPHAVVQQALKMFEAEVHQADITMDFQLDQSFKELEVDWVRFDPSRLLQVLINLGTNAIKFTSNQDRRVVTIALAAYRQRPSHMDSSGISYITARAPHRDITADDADWGAGDPIFLQFSVQDTGRGLSEGEKKLLFLRFSQASPKTHVQYGGSGLGLFISRELVELQGGEIGVSSARGQGSTFAFYIQARRSCGPPDGVGPHTAVSAMRKSSIPRAMKAKPSLDAGMASGGGGGGSSGGSGDDVVAAVGASPTPASPASRMGSLRVLIVEDNEVNQRVLSKQLRNLGAKVGVANHGGDCLAFLQRTNHWAGRERGGEDLAIILMDLEMPVMDGLTCAREIRKLQQDGQVVRHIPIIAV